nr:unnamed protein product [Callosobruchus analis]
MRSTSLPSWASPWCSTVTWSSLRDTQCPTCCNGRRR